MIIKVVLINKINLINYKKFFCERNLSFMLKIRQEQIDVLSENQLKSFMERAFDTLMLLSEDLNKDYNRKTLLAFIQKGISEANNYNIVTAINVIRYLKLKYQIGDNNWTKSNYKWIHDYLIKQLSAEKRLDLIIENLRFGMNK